MLRHVMLWTALISVQGCAYGTAIRRGADAAAEGRWEDALGQYQAALEKKPDGEEAVAGVAKASSELADAAVASARTHLGQREWQAAVDQVGVAEKYVPAHPEIPRLRYDIEAGMVQSATALRDEGKLREAYALASTAKRL